MSYRTICTVSVDDKAPEALEPAIHCARRWGAHLDAWCVVEEDVKPGISVYSTAVLTFNRESAETRSGRAASATEERLSREDIQWGSRGVAATHGEAVHTLSAHACHSDLAVLTSPLNKAARKRSEETFDALLFDTRLPVLVVDPGAEPSFDRVVIGCDGSPSSLCAIRAALPVLQEASEVDLVEVRTRAEPDDTMPAIEAAALYLSRQGVHADVTSVPSNGGSVADRIRAVAQEKTADLIVMGAYGRSKVREMLLGGTTRAMLETGEIPLLVAH